MITAASGAKNLLTDSAPLVAEFASQQMNADGGFRGRSSQSDLYYTVFGLETLIALETDFDKDSARRYLRTFSGGQSLDLIHLACLARCHANLSNSGDDDKMLSARIATRIELYRTADGGYANTINSQRGTAYGCFIALAAVQDLALDMPDAHGIIDCLASLRRPDGSYANDAAAETGSTPATAAALTALHYLGYPADGAPAKWLLDRCRKTGGFLATQTAPIPDLLSTATAIHALSITGASTDDVRQATIEFVDSLWDPQGAFSGNWLDDTLDCEYTYYALMTLGHLGKNK